MDTELDGIKPDSNTDTSMTATTIGDSKILGSGERREVMRVEIDLDLPEKVEILAFGQRLSILAPQLEFLRSDSKWRLRHIYQPALSTQTLPQTGVALDIGAGFGAFALPFAAAFPGWKIFCFEPDPISFNSLEQNISDLRLENVIALPFAVGCSSVDLPKDQNDTISALANVTAFDKMALAKLSEILPLRGYRRALTKPGYIERGSEGSPEYEVFEVPTIAASCLVALQPRLLKLIAPMLEKEILADLAAAELDHVIGESWSHVPSSLVSSSCRGLRQTWIPCAGQPMLSLRRSIDQSGRIPRLDVVVAMHNSQSCILDCISGIIGGIGDEIHAVVVDDGSTDASCEVVRSKYGEDPRVLLLEKSHGGIASSRNFGRMHSSASHIAFVDAGDRLGTDLFPGLLDLARHTGAEVVQGGYDLIADEGKGYLILKSSAEFGEKIPANTFLHDLGGLNCHLVPADLLIEGKTSVWRRVYRRDFLENRNIWFPEHVKSFSDHMFHLLTLQCVANVPILSGVSYGNRQDVDSAAQQADEEDFYVLEMFRLLLKRGVRDGWRDFTPILKYFIKTINRTAPRLNRDLRTIYIKGAAELWIYAHKTLGLDAFKTCPDDSFEQIDFSYYATHFTEALKEFDVSYYWAFLDAFEFHVPFLKSSEIKERPS